MENHLIIGLGGTGGRIIAAYRRIMFEKFKGNLNPQGVNIDFVYVDSSESDLNAEGGIWRTLGTSVALNNNSKVNIKPSNLKAFLQSIENYPYLKNWIGTEVQWEKIVNDPKLQQGAGGQKRRLGRFLFANNANKVMTVIANKVDNLQDANKESQKITFHVCTGLAGGTGSGSFIDTIVQIRKKYKDCNNYKIILYLLLPEENPNMNWATTSNYQPNGYAALMELNALDFQIFKPWDLTCGQNPKQLELDIPFYSAYLITEQNKGDVRFNVADEIPATIAEFLFQKTTLSLSGEVQLAKEEDSNSKMAKIASGIEAADGDAKKSMLARVESGENPETSTYDFKHSFKFITFGIKRLAIPEQEIKEYFVDTLANQFVLQAIYNNPAHSGFLEGDLSTDDYSEIIKSANTWNLSLPYLTLDKAVLDNHKTEGWKSIKDEFKVVNDFAGTVIKDSNIRHLDKLTNLEKLTKEFYEKDYRKIGDIGGVENFYRTKRSAIPEISKKILKGIEDELYSKWANGKLSFNQISKHLEKLVEYLENQKENLKTLENSATEDIKKKETIITQVNKDWQQMGIAKKMVAAVFEAIKDKRKAEFIDALMIKYYQKTYIDGFKFADNLLEDIISRISEFKKTISKINSTFNSIAKNLKSEITSKCNDDKSEVGQKKQTTIIKYYDPQKARDVAAAIIKDVNYRTEKVNNLRKSIIELMGENCNFETMKGISEGDIINKLQTSAFELVNILFKTNPNSLNITGYEKIVGDNIIDKLKEEFSGNAPGLKRKVKQLVTQANVLAKYNDAETNDCPVPIRTQLLIILPEYKGDTTFLNALIAEFKGIVSGDSNVQIETGGSQNEIVIINLDSIITPRYLQSVQTLKNAYEELVNSEKGDVARFETHLETVSANPLPSLYKPNSAELKFEKEKLPYLLLAKNLELVKEYENPETGKIALSIMRKDEWGIDMQPIFLGQDIESSINVLTYDIVNDLETIILKILKENYKHIDKQKELILNINNDYETLKTKYKGNMANPTVNQFLEAVKICKEIVTK